nr:PREDICTED: E3 ubiquitin/ISG15 ligase TRIM25-like isoform X1 [Equus przewalskii]
MWVFVTVDSFACWPLIFFKLKHPTFIFRGRIHANDCYYGVLKVSLRCALKYLNSENFLFQKTTRKPRNLPHPAKFPLEPRNRQWSQNNLVQRVSYCEQGEVGCPLCVCSGNHSVFSHSAGAKTTTPQANSVSLKAKVLEAFLAKSRSELLEYAVRVILDYNTAHSKVALSENYTVASVADVPQSYRPHPQRFMYCSQVLGLHCYKKGIHYWEVELQKNNFCGVGICYGSMQRQGPESRLGRNSSSWCVEQFNTKISAWHNNVEKTLPPTKATRVGVLLNCDHGFVIFFAVTDKVHLMYKYKVDFTEALYPAFWVFSAGATLSVCSSK